KCRNHLPLCCFGFRRPTASRLARQSSKAGFFCAGRSSRRQAREKTGRTPYSYGMNNVQLGQCFDQIADILEFQDANPFRVRAYRNASRILHDLPEPIVTILADPERKLTEIQGIGKDLAEKI